MMLNSHKSINHKQEQYVIVISYDAFSEDNWELASKQPNLAKLIKRGSYTTGVKSVYPTLTYVIHSSYVTGMYPRHHRVYHNNPLQPFEPEKDQRWFWYRDDIKAPTIYDEVAKHGWSTAALLWPVSGKSSIKHNIPEIRAIKNENQALKIMKSGSPLYSIGMELKYGKQRKGIQQPYLDDFTTLCAVDTIKRKKPNLFLMHLIDLDDAKHEQGTKGPHIEQVIKRMDRRIGDIVNAVEEAGIFEQTTFIVIGDHGQLDVSYKIHLNKALYEHGLIYEEAGEMKWRAYVQGAGGAAYLHVQPGDTEAEQQALVVLKELQQDDRYGIEAIWSRDELQQFHVDPSIGYMLEAREGYCFEDAYDLPLIVDLAARGEVYATHGYHPDKPNYRSIMVAAGKGIKQGYHFEQASVIDLAPTIAKLFHIPFGPCDGQAIDKIFEK